MTIASRPSCPRVPFSNEGFSRLRAAYAFTPIPLIVCIPSIVKELKAPRASEEVREMTELKGVKELKD